MSDRDSNPIVTPNVGIVEELPGPQIRTQQSATNNALSDVRNHPVYRAAWYVVNGLLVVSICLTLYAMAWEYSTRRYLKGFSDAVVPALATPEEKAVAIIDWMSHGPARLPASPAGETQDRDPTDTLNYASLLKVCGSATNAFINLADSSGLSSRRLLLVNADGGAKHVVAEVLIDGRWIVVDPSFRTIPRNVDGQLLTSRDLADNAVFSFAMQNISNYDPSYNYSQTSHLHLKRIPFLGILTQRVLDHYQPNWADSPALSLLVERESLAAVVTAALALLLFFLVRVSLRWYGESRLGIRTFRVRTQVIRATSALFSRGA